ncbi:MAG: flagellar hook-basal body protein [Calditrichaeota bacterium]|nr:flagellar hook-basal body protein [Calditrichota bacterium]
MIQGFQFSKDGLENKSRAIEVIANNLANVSSVGFKRSDMFSQSLRDAQTNSRAEPIPKESIDFAQGSIQLTGNPMDLAIEGDGFFSIDTKEGIRYTRQGNFKLDSEAFLTTPDGDYVLGNGGRIRVEGEIRFSDDGKVFLNGEESNQLDIVSISDKSKLYRAGSGLFGVSDERVVLEMPEAIKIRAGSLEASNVNAIEEMVKLIETYRQFEADQRALKAQDESLSKAVNDVGRV